MNKNLLTFLALFFISIHSSLSQDVIVKKNGEEMNARVLDFNDKEIRYKSFDDPDFTTYSMKTDQVSKIRFEDGTEKIFKTQLRHFIGIVYGGSNPISDFSQSNTENTKSGYAKHGNAGGIEAGFYIKKNLGLGISIGRAVNPFDTAHFDDPYQNQSQVHFDFDEEHYKYEVHHIMIGPFYSFRIGRKFALDVKFLVGLMQAKKPGYFFRYNSTLSPPVNYSFYYKDATGVGLAANPGLAFRWNFTKFLGLRVSSDFILGTPKLKNIVEINDNGAFLTEENTYYPKIRVNRLTAGLVFLINRK